MNESLWPFFRHIFVVSGISFLQITDFMNAAPGSQRTIDQAYQRISEVLIGLQGKIQLVPVNLKYLN